jgi:3-hydroxyisobutyrate dehydrogenase
MRVGVAGLGRMGTVMVERMLAAGDEVVVWNRSREKVDLLVAKGAIPADTPADVTRAADVILTVVKDAPAVAAVYEGPDGLLSADCNGKLFVDISTVQAATHVELAAKVEAKGAHFLEAPVGGSILVAREGRLLCFAAGDPADIERARPIFERFCRRIERAGPVGAGARLKMAINLPLLVYWQALGEALAHLSDAGYDPEWIVDLLSESSGGPNVLKVRGPSIAKALRGEEVPVTANVETIRKDLDLMLREAKGRGVESPLVAQTLASFQKAKESGLAGMDCSAFPAYWIREGNRSA